MSFAAFATTFKHAGGLIYSTNRPWEEFLDLSSLSLPTSYDEVTFRFRYNLCHFASNYFQLFTFTIFYSLFDHPHCMYAFFILFLSWLCLYFGHDGPLQLCGLVIPDSTVLIVLSLATGLAVAFTGVLLNVLVAFDAWSIFVCLHSVFMRRIVRLVDLLYGRPRRYRFLFVDYHPHQD